MRFKFEIIVGLLSLLPIAFGSASAVEPDPVSEDQPEIDEVVVVANKMKRSVRDVAANVTVLTRADINKMIATSVSDVFQYTPGIDYESAGTRFGAQGINIRGISGNRVAVLVDGVPLGDQFNVGSFSNATRDFINAGLVERIEVLHGPASALYGSAAIGGVVAVRTPDPANLISDGRHGGDLQATWRGADSSLHGTGLFAFGDDANGVLLGISAREGNESESNAVDESFDFRDYQRRSALLKYVANTQGGQTWRLAYLHQDTAVQSDLNSMLGTGRYRSTTALEGDDEYQMDMASVEYEFGAPESWVDAGVLRGYYQATSVQQSTLDERALARTPVSIDRYFQFDQDIAGIELNLLKNFDTGSVGHQLGFGFEFRNKRTEEFRDGNSTNLVDGSMTNVLLGEVFPLRDFPVSESQEWGAYVEDSLSLGNWTVMAALRADRYDLSPQDDAMFAEDYPFADPVSISESNLSPKLGVIYHAGQSTDIYLQYTKGFRAPPYEDANIGLEIPFFNYRAIPNPDLRSERSQGFDVGVRWQGLGSNLRFAAFRTDYTDFIESKMRLGEDPVSGRILFQSQNLASARIEGLEAGGSWRLFGALENFVIDGSAYVARGDNNDTGEALNSVGPAQAVVGIGWGAADGRRQLRLQSTFTGDWSRLDESSGELFKPPGYSLFDLFLTQRIGDRVSARIGLTNLTDKTYWAWSDVRGLSPDDPIVPYLARPGRSVTVSVDMNW